MNQFAIKTGATNINLYLEPTITQRNAFLDLVQFSGFTFSLECSRCSQNDALTITDEALLRKCFDDRSSHSMSALISAEADRLGWRIQSISQYPSEENAIQLLCPACAKAVRNTLLSLGGLENNGGNDNA